MANHPSAAKRNRQRLVRTSRNKSARSALRTILKNARVAIESGDKDAAATQARVAEIALARAASRGVIHGNQASRKTSRLTKAVAKLS